MSADIVDDLHAAEDRLGTARLLAQLLTVDDRGNVHVNELGRSDDVRRWILHLRDPYCRPGCGWRETGECDDEDPDLCGCPCNHEADATDGEFPPWPCADDPQGQHSVGCGCSW